MGNKLSNKLALPILIVLLIVGWFQYKKYIDSEKEVMLAPVLKEDEHEKYTWQNKTFTKISRRKKDDGTIEQVRETIEGVREVAITIKKDGSIRVYARSHGPIFEPGIAFGYSGKEIRVGVDAQLYYWKRYGVGTGINIDMDEWKDVRLYGAFYYNLPVKQLSNTSIYLGVDNKLDMVGGIRIKF